MNNASHFGRGSAVFTCRICKHNTRQTGRGDNDHVGLCALCFDLAGEENSLSDSGDFYESPENVLAMVHALEVKGADASSWAKLKETAQAKVAEKLAAAK